MVNCLRNDLDHILAHTERLWDELCGQRIFITGGTGFFGCWLLESFVWANEKLRLGASALVLTRDPETFRAKAPHLAAHPAIQFCVGDVRGFVLPAGRFSHIIHAATEASASLNEENPLLMLDAIVEGTRRTLEFARQCGAQKFLLTSSGAVYGKQPPDLTHIPEEHLGGPDPLDRRSAYGEGKRLAEMLCVSYARQYGLEAKIARCFAFVGPYLPLGIHYAVGNFIRDGLCGGPIQVKGDGTPYRSYLYAADLTIWLWTILFRGTTARAYNVGSDVSMTVEEVARAVSGCFSPPPQVQIAQRPNASQSPLRYVPCTARARSELGLAQRIDAYSAIKRTLEWYQKTAVCE